MDDSHPTLWQQAPDEGGYGSPGRGGTDAGDREGPTEGTASAEGRALTAYLMEEVCDPANLNEAYFRVVSNKGAAGVDGMHVDELRSWIRENKQALISSLLDGGYRPQPVKGVQIPKPGGKGKRQLGIPTVVDRLVQQAIYQVLSPILEPTFSPMSFGFRPGRSAHDALRQAQAYVMDDRPWVVDLDLEKFFDRVNHDMLMARLARHVSDKRLLRIVRRFLEADLMHSGVVVGVVTRREGTPQGGPLSPLLANLLLDDLDKELEKRGHRFVRYADDCNIYVRSPKAGERVMESVTRFLEGRLKLKVNQSKSAVAEVHRRKFLGYRLFGDGSLGIAPESLARLKAKIRRLTRRNVPRRLSETVGRVNLLIRGWVGYFHLARGRSHLADVDGWLRRRLRCIKLKQLKRAKGIGRFLLSRGLDADSAWTLAGSGKGWWRMTLSPQSHRAMNRQWFREQGLVSLVSEYDRWRVKRNRLGAEQACRVV